MVQSVLVPISMERYPDAAVNRANYLHKILGTDIYLLYIIEDNLFDEVKRRSPQKLGEREMKAIENNILSNQVQEADICFTMARNTLSGVEMKGCKVVRGLYGESILKAIDEFGCSLTIIEYVSPILTRYKILSRSKVPLWVERKAGEIEHAVLFSSNLSDNMEGPAFAHALEEKLGLVVDRYFINDPRGEMMRKEDIVGDGGEWKVLNASFDESVYRIVRDRGEDLAIVGRPKDRYVFRDRIEYARNMRCNVLLLD